VYLLEDVFHQRIRRWWARAIVAGLIVGVAGAVYLDRPPFPAAVEVLNEPYLPPVFGVGYAVVDHTLHLENADKPSSAVEPVRRPHQSVVASTTPREATSRYDIHSRLDRQQMLSELWWLLPLVVLKMLLTSITLAGGGSGGIFAPSLFIGATAGASFGLTINLLFPGISMHPGVYAIVGMGAVVAGTTHGLVSAILIVYEMTNDYRIMLPIMVSAGLASVVATIIDPESIYHKKLIRRGDSLARGHDMVALEHILVRDMMTRQFPTIQHTDSLPQILKIARDNPNFEVFPVLNGSGKVYGTIRAEDLRWILDAPITPELIRATDIAVDTPIVLSPDENILEAIRDFGTGDTEFLPVEDRSGDNGKLVGMLLRSDVMRRYREELLSAAVDRD
jgi:CIC family chloride channel protein